jgi:hypothetical protein
VGLHLRRLFVLAKDRGDVFRWELRSARAFLGVFVGERVCFPVERVRAFLYGGCLVYMGFGLDDRDLPVGCRFPE